MTAEVKHNPDQTRFEVFDDGRLAGFVDYELSDQVVDFTHTEVDSAFEGRGLAKELATGALGYAREQGLAAIPTCAFFTKFIQRNGEYADLVPADRRGEFGLDQAG
ncbi:GNAT family N-acetyltransferase [Nocardioides pacificus]